VEANSRDASEGSVLVLTGLLSQTTEDLNRDNQYHAKFRTGVS
jgi:hypothetical protein